MDRLWPRGLRRDDVHFDEWCKEVAPSPELRAWYGPQQDRFAEFARRYEDELGDPERQAAVHRLRERATGRLVTLLTASKDVAVSHASVLQAVVDQHERG